MVDFGLSKHAAADERLHAALGTLHYAAPEVLFGNYDAKCDIWSSGVVLYIMLCGKPPFDAKREYEVARKIKLGHIYFPEADWGSVSTEAKGLVRKLLEFVSEKRPSAQRAL